MEQQEEQGEIVVDKDENKKQQQKLIKKAPLSRRYNSVRRYVMSSKYTKGAHAGERIGWQRKTIVGRKNHFFAFGQGSRGSVLMLPRMKNAMRTTLKDEVLPTYKKEFLGETFSAQLTAGAVLAQFRLDNELANDFYKRMAVLATDNQGHVHQITGRHALLAFESYNN